MKVSVVIPAHNEEGYIRDALRYVLAQDFPEPFEVIVVDNASTDKTYEIASAFSDVHVVREPRKGTQWARERGRQEAKGEILAYLDADSLPPRDWLKKGVEACEKPGIVAVSGVYDYYDAPPFYRWSARIIQITFYGFLHFLLHDILQIGAVLVGGNFFANKEALERIGGFDTSILFYGDDAHISKQLRRVGRIHYDTDLIVKSSFRRFRREGWWRVWFKYLLNSFWIYIRNKPLSYRQNS